MSITCPAYRESDKAGTTSANPINPIAKGSFVSSYNHHPTKVPIIRNPIMKQKRPIIRLRYSGILTAAKGSCLYGIASFNILFYGREK